ncbi:ArgS-related anticodon-binding protein NrtL [Streptomyces sp. NPDC059698]|uniref:ArgS-related anticodon-binding protein NrtL n=1 Tax=unclassified Streptomyces TaxID=2593676 RepID=UPI00093CF8CD|nr:DALR anticodon-binding domain-containing protein [Streptomyces sp. CB02366]OKJ40441.1 arginyl-tRNA synthetase [Streptomyces sp. CB02366]
MTPADLSRTVLRAVRRAVDEEALHAPVPAHVRVERTRPGGSGDYACAVALQLAGPAALPALEVARILRDRVAAEPGVGRVEITGPGFLSFTVAAPAEGDRAVLAAVREQGPAYGHGDALRGEAPHLCHAGGTRAAVTADAVRRLLTAQGARVRVSSPEPPDPDWPRLGVALDAPPAPGPARTADAPPAPGPAGPLGDRPHSVRGPHAPRPLPATEIRPVPAGATAGELLERLGPDAARWGLLRAAGHDRAALGPELLVQGEANPLFLVRYAHARTRALTRGAVLLGFASGPAGSGAHDRRATHAGHAAHLGHDAAARPLLDLIADHPGVLLAGARHRAPDRVARQLEAVAHAFFDFHDSCPPLPAGDEKPSAAHRARLALAEAAGTVLAGGLSLLGIRAPEHL